MRNADGEYTNLALILSDQNPRGVEVFAEGEHVGTVRASATVLIDRAEKLAIEARTMVAENRGRTPPKVPVLAFREMLLNAITHRSYCRAEDVRIDLEKGCTRITSPGTPQGMVVAFAMTRNPVLAESLGILGLKNLKVRNLTDSVSLYKTC